jgi:hypothetical protein
LGENFLFRKHQLLPKQSDQLQTLVLAKQAYIPAALLPTTLPKEIPRVFPFSFCALIIVER